MVSLHSRSQSVFDVFPVNSENCVNFLRIEEMIALPYSLVFSFPLD